MHEQVTLIRSVFDYQLKDGPVRRRRNAMRFVPIQKRGDVAVFQASDCRQGASTRAPIIGHLS
jgi:hypothetical protein